MIKNKKYLIIGLIIVIVACFLILPAFLAKPPAFHFNCVNGTFLGISGPLPIMYCTGCLEHCDAHILVKDNDGNEICEESGSSIALTETPTRVSVPCIGLENFVDKNVSLNYEVNSTYGYFAKEITLVAKWGKYEGSQ